MSSKETRLSWTSVLSMHEYTTTYRPVQAWTTTHIHAQRDNTPTATIWEDLKYHHLGFSSHRWKSKFSKWNHVPTLPHAPLLCEPSISTGWHVSLRQIMYVRVSLPRWLLQILAVYQQAYLVFVLGTGVNWWKIDFWTRPRAVPKA